jgi:ribonuclease R
MSKLKLRYRDQILQALHQSSGPIPLKALMKALFPKEDIPRMERTIVKELRFLIKLKDVEKGQGNLYRIRPPKTNKARLKREREHDFEEKEGRRSRLEINDIKRDSSEPRGRPAAGGRKPKDLITGKVSKNSRGFAFVAPINPPAYLKEDVFLNPEEAEELLTGDIVEITLDNDRSEKGYSGRLVNIVERGMTKTVARYIKGTPYAPALAEVESKDVQLQIVLENDPIFKDVVDGAAILVEVTHGPQGGEAARGKIVSVLADSLNSTTDDPYIIVKHKLRENFPDEVIAEAEAVPSSIQKSDLKGREDLRELPFVTIDGADARDFDDAVCAKTLPGGAIRLWVAVADVAHYVTFGSAIDTEAYARGTSVYFPHRVLPMLPERLSNGLCSLNPHEDRLVMVAEIDFDSSGRKTRHKVVEAVFRSQHRCIYETLQQFFDRPNDKDHEYNPQVKESLNALFDLYKKLHPNRIRRGAIDLNLPEAKVKVNRETGEPDAIVRTERMDTHRLIEEFMIAANEAVSEIMEHHKQSFIFRVHETPEQEAAQRFLDVAKSLHTRVNEKWIEDITPQNYQKILRSIEENPASRVLNFLLLRSMKQAFYSAENLKHFGLASQAYSHFTSPIRRYPDLMVHRLLKAFIHKSKKEQTEARGSVANSLEEAAAHCSARERVATDAERELIRIKQVRYAERHLGEEHTGTVVGINAKGAFIELVDAFIEGYIPLERFGTDFSFNEKLYHLRGKRTGQIIQIGDKIEVQIVRTTPHLLQIELEPLQGKFKHRRLPVERAEEKPAARGRSPERPPERERERERRRPEARGKSSGRRDRAERSEHSDRSNEKPRREKSFRGERSSGREQPTPERAKLPEGPKPAERAKSSEKENPKPTPGRDFWKLEDFE